MQAGDDRAQAGEQATAVLAFGEVALHSGSCPPGEVAVEVAGHASRRPLMVAIEARTVRQLAHLASDPVIEERGSQVQWIVNVCAPGFITVMAEQAPDTTTSQRCPTYVCCEYDCPGARVS